MLSLRRASLGSGRVLKWREIQWGAGRTGHGRLSRRAEHQDTREHCQVTVHKCLTFFPATWQAEGQLSGLGIQEVPAAESFLSS